MYATSIKSTQNFKHTSPKAYKAIAKSKRSLQKRTPKSRKVASSSQPRHYKSFKSSSKKATQSKVSNQKFKKSLYYQVKESCKNSYELDVINSAEFARVLRKAKAVNSGILISRLSKMEDLKAESDEFGSEPETQEVVEEDSTGIFDFSSSIKIVSVMDRKRHNGYGKLVHKKIQISKMAKKSEGSSVTSNSTTDSYSGIGSFGIHF